MLNVIRPVLVQLELSILAGLFLALLQGSPTPPGTLRDISTENSLLKAMRLEEKAGQVLMVRVVKGLGGQPAPEMKGLIEDVRPGAVILYGMEDAATTAELANQLQRWAYAAGIPPLLVASDFEFGPRMMVRSGVTTLPQQMGLGAAFDPGVAFDAARVTAREARAMGVNWVLAPVADVNTNPRNPVIGVRAFGDDPAFVASFVTEAVRGYSSMGVLASAKHFPGHGDTSLDSHLALPRVDYGRDVLERHLEPFRAAIAAGVPTIMTAHILVSALDPDRPATLSPAVLTGLLREELGFEGVIITDAMNMAAIAEHFGTGEAAVLALNAGADMILSAGSIHDAQTMYRAIVEAVRSGVLPEARLDEAVQRVLALKRSLGLLEAALGSVLVDPDEARRICASPEHTQRARELAHRAVTLVKDERNWLPLDVEALKARGKGVLVLGVRDSVWTLQGALRERAPGLEVEAYRATRARATNNWSPSRSNIRRAIRLAERPEIGAVVVLTYSARTLSEGQLEWVRALLDLGDAKPVIVVAEGLPYDLIQVPEAPAYLALYAQNRWEAPEPAHGPMFEALADVILGRWSPQGRLPVDLPGLFPRGHGLSYEDLLRG